MKKRNTPTENNQINNSMTEYRPNIAFKNIFITFRTSLYLIATTLSIHIDENVFT